MTSIARKFIMGLSGLFLITFLITHLAVNSLSIVSQELFNKGSHFMATNPLIQGMQFVLAAGFIIHIAYGIILTLKNNAARPQKYAYNKPGANSSLSSRSMIYSGLLVLAFLVLHMKDFFMKLKFPGVFGDKLEMVKYSHGGLMMNYQDDFALMNLFAEPLYLIIYVLAFIALGIHLHHGFQSAFQSLGVNNRFTPAIKMAGKIFCVVIAAGFSLIAIVHYINFSS